MEQDTQSLNPWRRPEEFEAFVETGKDGFIFKHSTRCSISSFADAEVQSFVSVHPEVPVYQVLVVENRDTSRAVADGLQVTHASPQVILVRDGKAVWDTSHNGVTADALAQAWQNSPAG